MIKKAQTKRVKKLKTFSLKSVGRTWKELREFGDLLIRSLGDDVFIYDNKTLFLFHILKQISPVNRTLEQTEYAVELACTRIIESLGLHLDGKLSVFTDEGLKEIKTGRKSNTDRFCEIILEIDKVPSHIYDSLAQAVLKDLLSLSDLIKWYETELPIQKYLKHGDIPKTHAERIIYDFYKRCVDERAKILDFQLYGLKERALAKSKYSPSWIVGLSWMESFRDKPYLYGQPFSPSHFDCRKIDLAGHRIGEFSFQEALILQKLYTRNKVSFYRKYFKKVPVQQHFDSFRFYLSHLPLRNDRSLIFNELIRLFKARKWISFYALALPQVEGLFSEMCLAISPDKDFSQKSLTHKVDSVRPFHNLSVSYFDYYQYHIPLQRNRFSHTGYDEDFKLKSYDLLVDLLHLLKVFYELENPLVKIKKLYVRRNFEDFISLQEFTEYFKLLQALKPQQRKEIQKSVDDFEKDFLSRDCGIDFICFEFMQELPKKVDDLFSKANSNLKTLGLTIDLKKIKIPEIDSLLKDKATHENIGDSFLYNNETVEVLDTYSYFLANYKHFLPSLREEVNEELEKVKSEYSTALRTISHINGLLKQA